MSECSPDEAVICGDGIYFEPGATGYTYGNILVRAVRSCYMRCDVGPSGKTLAHAVLILAETQIKYCGAKGSRRTFRMNYGRVST